MTRKQQKQLMRIGICGLLLIAAALLPFRGWARLAAFAVTYLLMGWDILWRSARNIARGQVFDENFLMSVATLGAFVIGEYAEGCFVMIFYQLGEWFEHYAVNKSRRSIAQLMDIRPDFARVRRPEGLVEVHPDELSLGEWIQVRPGERIPLDGSVAEGESTLDTAALTGESLPQTVGVGDAVISGCVNLTGVLMIRVEKSYGESTVTRILELVENAASRKATMETFMTRFARYYTPGVVMAALALAVIPALVDGQWAQWMERALIFLVISCPCALVISVPLSYFGGIAGASRQGVLIKGANYLEALAKVKTVVLDKTGTLTTGKLRVTAVHPVGMDREQWLHLAAHGESASRHPIAQGIREAYGKPLAEENISDIQEHAGRGVSAVVAGRQVLAGTADYLTRQGIVCEKTTAQTTVHLAVEGVYAGYAALEDALKPEAASSLEKLKKLGVRRTVMLTGDTASVGERIARAVGLDTWHCQLLPQEKVDRVEQLMKDPACMGALAFVGDGINDAPVLSRADVGIAMGAMGSDAAIEAADVVLMDDRLDKLPQAMGIARKTQRIVVQNIIFALGVKVLVMVLGAMGVAGLWAASFADVGVAVLAILNAMRCMRAQ